MSREKYMSPGKRKMLRRELYDDNPKCYWCGNPMILNPIPDSWEREYMPTIEHLVPRREGGDNSRENIRLVHKRCNR